MPKGEHMKTEEHRKRISKQNTKHGDARIKKQTKLYVLWASMKQRCFNPSTDRYAVYGGRGIRVCEEWRNSYIAFKKWALSAGYRKGLTIHRVNKDKDYSPENCIFITTQEHNQLNTPPHKLKISDAQIKEIFNLSATGMKAKQIADLFSVSVHTVYDILEGANSPRYKRLYQEVKNK